jgi:hypothetical protein
MRFRVFGLSGCLGEFIGHSFRLSSQSKRNLLVWPTKDNAPFYSVEILYQEVITYIHDDHGRVVYNEALSELRGSI